MKKGMSVWKGMSGKKKTAVAIVSLAGICILGTGVFWARNKMSKGQPVGNASVQEASAASGDIANTITGTGSLEADDSDTVKIPSGITIKEVKVESGDAVSKGDVLAVVEETSVLGAMEEVQEQIEETEEDMNECKSDTETQEVTAKVSGRIKKIYVQESSDVAQSMVDNGALMLLSLDGKMAADFTGVSGVAAGDTVTVTLSDGTVKEGSVESVSGADCTVTFSDDGVAVDDTVTAAKADGTKIGTGKAYIHEQLEITGTGGTVSSVSAAENQEVSAGDTLLTVNTGEKSVKYRQLAAKREALTQSLQKLVIISQTGTITADIDGTVGSVNVSAGSAVQSSSAVSSGTTSSGSSAAKASNMSYTSSASGASFLLLSSASETAAGKETALDNDAEQQEDTQSDTENQEQQTDICLQFAIGEGTESTAGLLALATPQTDGVPQTEANSSDGAYTGSIVWNPQADTFEGGTEYQAQITLTAGEGYCFGADSVSKLQVGILSGLTVSEDAKTLEFCVTFPVTAETTPQETQKEQNESGQDENKKQVSGSDGETVEASAKAAAVTGTSTGTAAAADTETTAQQTSSSDSTEDTSSYSTDVTAFTLASNDSMILSVSVDELDINSVSKDQEAEVTLDALEDSSFTGTVTKVGGSSQSSGNGVAKYTVEITIPKDAQMKEGMNASAVITVEEKKDVVTIPVNALQEKGDKTFVYTKKDDEGNLSGEQEVSTGLSDGDKVEITDGLSEGDTVYYQKTGNTQGTDSGQTPQQGGGPGNMEQPSGGGMGEMPSGGGPAPGGN
ncbi:biotin/lipoyl-binding protein [Blautia hansenii]|uniref:Biotin/lipoyl-binding protein n=2 Tax=Blautia hansenii TaxID=1322 RepID=A0ABX2I734_BLAHA|nr:biotin/lipoyl-binding protein [Blautia hansenii]MCB5600704.1 biotin/lipoyl-binding protein [Blautia hansenii]NSJ86268.1 biotin/lipoyl-binding protein [Blautia hansenii]